MAMRHWQRVMRVSSAASWSSAQRGAGFYGVGSSWEDLERPSSLQSSAPPPTMLESARGFSSAYPSPRSTFRQAGNVHEYNKLISTINYKRRPNLVRDVYEDMLMDGVQPVRDTFYLLISGCMRGSRLQDVMFFFEEMKAMGLTPDGALFDCVIAACGRSMQVDRAFKLSPNRVELEGAVKQVADEMEAFGIQLKHRTFLTLLRSCAIAGRVDEGYGVVRRMAASGLSLDNNFYSALIAAHRNKKPFTKESVQKIFEVLEQSKHQSAEDFMAVAATGNLDMTDDLDDGLGNLMLEDTQNRRGYVNPRLTVYRAALAALSSVWNKEGVKTVLKMIEQDGHERDTYCVIQLIKWCLAEGDFEEACAEFNKYVDGGEWPTLELYILLIEGALETPSPAGSAIAQKLLVELGEKGYFLNAQLGTLLLEQACKPQKRDIAVANLVWDMMKNREVRISKYITQEYYKALAKSDIPKDDPRLLAVKALVDVEPRVNLTMAADPGLAVLEQVPAEQGKLHPESQNDLVGDSQSSIETDSGSENPSLSPALVADYEKH